jgi:hypothetical protein
VRPLAAVLLFCASCFSQAGSSRKPPSLSDADEVRIGKYSQRSSSNSKQWNPPIKQRQSTYICRQ